MQHFPSSGTYSECGKREAHIDWSVVTCKKAAPVTGTTLRTTDPVPADSRQVTPSVRNCIPIHSNRDCDPMAVDGTNVLGAVAESGKNPASNHQIQPACRE